MLLRRHANNIQLRRSYPERRHGSRNRFLRTQPGLCDYLSTVAPLVLLALGFRNHIAAKKAVE
ncbi:MAG: hypothetical protein DMF04_00250 [Verrucomicrobia bacterium]|nr:MAG: hypothetical protein DMF04_00250 [Verrucomicrobiota bacterium]